MSVVAAPSPDEKARPCAAPSSDARHSCSAVRVGFADAGVVVALVDADRLLHVGRGLVDRRRDRAGRRVRRLPLVDRARLEVHRADATGRVSAPSHVARLRERLVRARRVPPRAEHLELPRLAVEARLDAADEAVAGEDRQDVVAVLALRLRHVHLEAVVEVEERLGPVAVVDEAVEGREERDAVGNRVRRRSRDAPPSPSASSRTPSARKRCSANARSASRSETVSTSGYQRSARSHSRLPPVRPTTATTPRVLRIWSMSDTFRAPHHGCRSSRRARVCSRSSRESIGPLRSSSRRT